MTSLSVASRLASDGPSAEKTTRFFNYFRLNEAPKRHLSESIAFGGLTCYSRGAESEWPGKPVRD